MSELDRDEVRGRLQEVFREVFDDDTIAINDETISGDIDEWDSLMHITLVVATESEFGLRLNAAEVGKLANVGSLIDILVERGTQ